MIKPYSCHAIKIDSYFWILRDFVSVGLLCCFILTFVEVDNSNEDMILFDEINFWRNAYVAEFVTILNALRRRLKKKEIWNVMMRIYSVTYI